MNASKESLDFSTRILRECRDLASTKLQEALPAVFDRVDDALFDMADKGENHSIQSLYMDAMREIRKRRPDMESKFPRALAHAVNDRMSGKNTQDPEPGSAEEPSLTLINDDDLEQTLAVTNMASKVRADCKDQLFALDRRVAFLLGQTELEGEDNPLGPECVLAVFPELLESIDAEVEIKLIILKLVDRFVGVEMNSLYNAINEHLVKRDVLPHIKTDIKRNPSAPGRNINAPIANSDPSQATPIASPYAQNTGPYAAYAPGPSGLTPPSPIAPGQGHVIYDALSQLMRGAMPTSSGDMGIDGELMSADPAPEVLSGLTALQHDVVTEPPPHTGGDLNAALASANVLRNLKTGAMAGSFSQNDELLIDIVAMMFDYILDDDHLAPQMKLLIGRLQIPVLKVAIIDKTLFSRRFHPVRKLLNSFAEAAMGWDESDVELYECMSTLIHTVLDKFDNDAQIFADVLKEFELFRRDEESEASEISEREARHIQRQEYLERAKDVVKAELKGALAEHPEHPQDIRIFLTHHWSQLLLVSYIRDGAQSEAWDQALGTMKRLLWSVTPKADPDERSKLAEVLPELLNFLNEGIERIGMRRDDRDELVAVLASHHADIISGRETNDEASPIVTAAVDEIPEYDGMSDPEYDTPEVLLPSVEVIELSPPQGLMMDAAHDANAAIREAQRANRHNEGMATTLVSGVFVNNCIHYIHVGDSRLYRLRGEKLEQLTRDHSLLQELIDRGFYTKEDAAKSGKKNLVTRGLGVDDLVEPEVASALVEPDDVYLFCSDGLTDMVDEDKVQAIVRHHREDVEHLAQVLVDVANEAGGEDNISVIAVHVSKPFPRRRWYRSKGLAGKLHFAGLTDVGRARDHNEDSIALDPDAGIVVLADGMGGMNAGEVASAIAVRSMLETIAGRLDDVDVSELPQDDTEVDFALEGENAPDAPVEEDGETTVVDPPVLGDEADNMVVEEVSVDELDPEFAAALAIEAENEPDASADVFNVDAETERAFTDPDAITGTGDVADRMRALLNDDASDIDAIRLDPMGQIDNGPLFEDQYNHVLESQTDDDFDLFDIGGPDLDDGDEYDLAVRSLRSGTWIEFHGAEGDMVKARLTWISSINGTYMFTDRKGTKVAEHSAVGLANALRDNKARILSDVPLYDRALSNLMDRLKGDSPAAEESPAV